VSCPALTIAGLLVLRLGSEIERWLGNSRGRFAFVLVLITWMAMGSTFAQTTPLITLTNTPWRYNDTALDLSAAWRAVTYGPENSWPSGVGLFGVESTVPYPYPVPVRTALVLGAGRTTYYFRTHFNFSGNPSAINLRGVGYIDDGAVFYINGAEAGRVRLPSGSVGFTNRAQLAFPEGVPLTLNFPTTNLVQGDNLLAVEVHQYSDTSSDVVFGLALDAVLWDPPIITNPEEPADRTLPHGESTILSVYAAGPPPLSYRWFQNHAAIPGANDSTLSLANVSGQGGGNYFVIVSNVTGSVTSRTAAVTYLADTNPPVVLYALRLPDLFQVLVVFSEPPNYAEATDALNWATELPDGNLGPGFGGGVIENLTNLVLTALEPFDPSLSYVMKLVEGGQVHDLFDNLMAPGTTVPLAWFETPLITLTSSGARYNQSGTDLGSGWFHPSYDDSGSNWLAGVGPFDAFRSSAGIPACRPMLRGDYPVGTCLTLSNAANTAQLPTIYFRIPFTFQGDASRSVLRLETMVNDGVVFYLNGAEIIRSGMPEGAITYDTLATRVTFPGDTFHESFRLSGANLVEGSNLLAVEVHQFAVTSTDLTLAVTLTGIVPTVPPVHPQVSINFVGGNLEVSWNPALGMLESTDNLNGTWLPVTPSNPPGLHITTPAGNHRFYRVTVP
jgi:hypothetical protein